MLTSFSFNSAAARSQTLFPVQYALAHGRLRQKHKDYVSRLLQQNIQLSEASLISGSFLAS